MPRRLKILCVCSDNAVLSPMAQAFLSRHGGDRFDVHSAGIDPIGIDPLTVLVMAEVGYDLSGRQSGDLDRHWGRTPPDYLVVVDSQADAALPAPWPRPGRRIYWPLETSVDASSKEERLAEFRRIRDRIDRGSLSLCSLMLARSRGDGSWAITAGQSQSLADGYALATPCGHVRSES